MKDIPFVDEATIAKILDYPTLIQWLDEAFRSNNIVTPQRHHHDYQGTKDGLSSTLLLMPSWETAGKLGIKLITVSPDNHQLQLPAIQGIYMLFDATTGLPQMLMDAKELTVRRTAAASALASRYLSREDSEILLMIGTGALAPHLIRAHASVRPIKRVIIWGRNREKATALAKLLTLENYEVEVAPQLNRSLSTADIISCATLSNEPLVSGAHLVAGQHIDLVGSYKKDMREADDSTILRSTLYVDTEAAKEESGDLYVPMQTGLIGDAAIKGDLFQLCSAQQLARNSDEAITLFKSVGHALEDLVAAKLVSEKLATD